MPLAPGVHRLNGLRLVCVEKNETFNFEGLVDIFVAS